MAPNVIAAVFWNDESVELNTDRVRKSVPALPNISGDYQTLKGSGMEALAFFALQVVKTKDKLVIMRAIASACSCLFNDSTNYTGSSKRVEAITGLDVAAADDADPDQLLVTNFLDAEDVTIGELLGLMSADADELGAYFGVLFTAGNKRITTENRSAFNEKRRTAATASIIGEAVIFVNDSPFLADQVLAQVYAAFLSCSPIRARMTALVVHRVDESAMGACLAFTTMFLLLVDSGMGALRIIKEAVLKHPWIRTDFPELKPELAAANEAQNIIKAAPSSDRSFLKAIHGNHFVPVNYSQIDNLTGVCRTILQKTTPSYKNYRGGKITDGQKAIIESHTELLTQVAEIIPSD